MTEVILFVGPIVAVAIAAIVLWRWWHGLIAAALGVAVLALGMAVVAPGSGMPWIPMAVVFGALVGVYSFVYGAKRLVLWGTQSWPRAGVATLMASVIGAALLIGFAMFVRVHSPSALPEFAHRIADQFGAPCTAGHVPIPVLPQFDEEQPGEQQPYPTELPAAYAAAPIVKEVWRNFIGPNVSIRTPDATTHAPDGFGPGSVTLTAVVDERGNVVVAVPIGGPIHFHDQAVGIARRWKFKPFTRDGKPRVVRIERIGVSIRAPERRAPGGAPFPKVKDWSSLRVRLFHRIHGFGGVDYDLTIRGDGLVVYEGRWGVALKGRHCAVVSRQVLERLVSEFERAQFFTLDGDYSALVSDFNSVHLSISFDGRQKSVQDYAAHFLLDVPDAVLALPVFTEHAVQAQRWVIGNRYTVPSLKAENWNFSQLRMSDRGLLARIATFGDAEAVRALLEAGADPIAPDEFGNTALTNAQAREDGAEIVAVLEAWLAAQPKAQDRR
jgi:Domain of unknown function (DUF6438)